MGGAAQAGIARRLAELIARRDHGNERVAAARLGITYDALRALLEPEARDDAPSIIDAATVGAIVRGYQVDACWLLTGERDLSAYRAEHDEWLHTTDLLFEIGRSAAERRRSAATSESTSSSA